ncbi:MAG: hypothetical protein KME46_32610 [Brasilonema angustatum HA4187-MV1]|jgi:hypothetical protein|nr:hypothetical protein [Brasilonema angustatum HA4187-MV1]
MAKVTIADLNDELVELTDEEMQGVNGGNLSYLVTAFKVGYAIGTALNNEFHLSDKIVDAIS